MSERPEIAEAAVEAAGEVDVIEGEGDYDLDLRMLRAALLAARDAELRERVLAQLRERTEPEDERVTLNEVGAAFSGLSASQEEGKR